MLFVNIFQYDLYISKMSKLGYGVVEVKSHLAFRELIPYIIFFKLDPLPFPLPMTLVTIPVLAQQIC